MDLPNSINIALLIDADNAQPKLLKQIIEEVSKYGKATIRRIYGDWTNTSLNGWKTSLNDFSFNPIQKFAYTTGKNSTDSSLIIDAMDILHSKKVEGFCIVSSDSDYTGLAKRIREEGVFMMGIGEKKTPMAFVQSCEIFTYSENIAVEITTPVISIKDNRRKKSKSHAPVAPPFASLIDKAFDITVNEDTETHISKVGITIRKMDPAFDPRAFGFKNLTQLFESLPNYTVIRNQVGGFNHPLVRRNTPSS
jgi:hypothetical protein